MWSVTDHIPVLLWGLNGISEGTPKTAVYRLCISNTDKWEDDGFQKTISPNYDNINSFVKTLMFLTAIKVFFIRNVWLHVCSRRLLQFFLWDSLNVMFGKRVSMYVTISVLLCCLLQDVNIFLICRVRSLIWSSSDQKPRGSQTSPTRFCSTINNSD